MGDNMQATLINDWYLTTDSGGSMGTTNTSGITNKQQHNAIKVYNFLSNLGWTLNSISAIIGNMQLESWLSPALIQATNRYRLPNSAANLTDVPNSVMLNFYDSYYGQSSGGYGVGLVQWDGSTNTAPAGQKLVSFAERYNLNWYDGDTQVYRLQREKETNIQFIAQNLGGTFWTWDVFVASTDTPENLAYVWRVCYEVAAGGTDSTRQANARYWYDYLSNVPPGPPGGEVPPWLLFQFNKRKVNKNVRRNIQFSNPGDV